MSKASISRAWEETRAIVARDGSLFASIALALLVLPGLVGDLLIPSAKGRGLAELQSAGAGRLVGMAIIFVIALVGQLAIIRLASGARLTVGGAIAHAARRAPVYIAAGAIWMLPLVIVGAAIVTAVKPDGGSPTASVALAVLIGTLVLLIGGSIMFVRMIMTAPVAANEGVGPVELIRRSWELTRGNWLRLFGFFLLFILAVGVLMAAVGAVVGSLAGLAFGELERMSIGAFIVSVVMQLVGAAVSVTFSVMLARIYLQLSGTGHARTSVPSSAD
ncbi:MAG: glycerophosphoryl diester phosphodiesterase membrane domain-containing protein [Sphingomicrobium sp.]